MRRAVQSCLAPPAAPPRRTQTLHRLGLTDAALLEAATVETPVLTVDLGLYLAAAAKAPETAVNFTHLRDL